MARIFTTKFTFNHQVYDAIVTMYSNDGKVNFNIKVLDIELQDLLPGGQIIYQGKDGFRDIPLSNHLSHSLVNSIANSIEQHLTVQP